MRRALLLVVPVVAGLMAPPRVARSADLRGHADAGEPPVVTVAVAPSAFSPNGDGAKDAAAVTIELGEAAALDVAVRDASGATVATLASDLASPAGTTELEWTGATDAGGTAADGTYDDVVDAVDAEGSAAETSAEVVLDTEPPTVAWRDISPEPLVSVRPVRFTFRAWDRSETLSISFSVEDSGGEWVARVRGIVRARGRATVSWDARHGNGDPVLPGLYSVRLAAVDDAGNRAVSVPQAFRDHRPVDTRVWHTVDGAGRLVALTFDDCNFAGAWRRILAVLEARHATASFFCLGINVNRYPVLARRTVGQGQTIGSHAWDHALLTTLGFDAIRRRLEGDEAAWWRTAGVTPAPYFRPPYGVYDRTVLRAAGRSGYLRTMLWDVDPRDWTRPGPSAIRRRVLSAAGPGSIVVMHAIGQTAAALPGIIGGLRGRGLEPVSLARMFAAA